MADGSSKQGSSRPAWLLFALPAGLLLAGVMIIPLLLAFWTSVAEPKAGLGNYAEFFESATYLRILWRTIWTAAIVTLVCLLLGYPYAYLMTLAGRRTRMLLTVAVLVPFWTSAIVRIFGWMVLLQPSGLVNRALALVGLGPFELLGNLTGTLIGMVQVMLPLMILPLYSTMGGIDRRLMVAACSLGATPSGAFRKVYLPLSRPGILAGSVIVFVSSLGFYLVPQMLGSPQQQLLSQLIFDQVSSLLNFGLGAAMAVILLAATLLVLAATSSVTRGSSHTGTISLSSSKGHPTLTGRRPLGLGIVALFVAAILVAPAIILVPLSFTAEASFVFPPKAWSVRWYEHFFTDGEWIGSLLTSLKIALMSAVISTILGSLAALGIVRSRSHYTTPMLMVMLIPRVVPHVVLAVAVFAFFLVLGLVGKVSGFVIAHTALAIPLVVITMTAGLQMLDERLELAAASLGANRLRQIQRVTAPMMLPSILTAAVFAFVTSFDEVIISLFLQSPFLRTLPVKMFSSIQDQIDPTIAAASTLIFLVATVTITVSLFARGSRHAARG
ncbi:MAG: ABC transporter permease subunit [Rhizobiaceae bacterium]